MVRLHLLRVDLVSCQSTWEKSCPGLDGRCPEKDSYISPSNLSAAVAVIKFPEEVSREEIDWKSEGTSLRAWGEPGVGTQAPGKLGSESWLRVEPVVPSYNDCRAHTRLSSVKSVLIISSEVRMGH